MKGLLKLALLAGLGAFVWKARRRAPGRPSSDDRAPVHSSGIVRDAGPRDQAGIADEDWDIIDEQLDESFPASDPPGNYRGTTTRH